MHTGEVYKQLRTGCLKSSETQKNKREQQKNDTTIKRNCYCYDSYYFPSIFIHTVNLKHGIAAILFLFCKRMPERVYKIL